MIFALGPNYRAVRHVSRVRDDESIDSMHIREGLTTIDVPRTRARLQRKVDTDDGIGFRTTFDLRTRDDFPETDTRMRSLFLKPTLMSAWWCSMGVEDESVTCESRHSLFRFKHSARAVASREPVRHRIRWKTA